MSDNMYTITSFCSYVPITIVRWRLYTYCNFWILICDTSKCNLSYPCWRISSFNIIIWTQKYDHDLTISIPWTFYWRKKENIFILCQNSRQICLKYLCIFCTILNCLICYLQVFSSCPLIRGVINMVIFDYTYNENLSTDYDANLLWGRQGHWHHWLDIVSSYRTMMRKLGITCFHDTLFRSL